MRRYINGRVNTANTLGRNRGKRSCWKRSIWCCISCYLDKTGSKVTASLFYSPFLSFFATHLSFSFFPPPLSSLPLPTFRLGNVVREVAIKKLLWDFRTIPKKLLSEFLSEIKLLRFPFPLFPLLSFPSPISLPFSSLSAYPLLSSSSSSSLFPPVCSPLSLFL